MLVKLICPECKKSSAPKKPRTFDCPVCGYHSNYSINIDNTTHYYKAGRRRIGVDKLVVQAYSVEPWMAKMTSEDVRFSLDKARELGYICL